MKVSEAIKSRPVYKVLRSVMCAGSFKDKETKQQVDYSGMRVIVGVCNRDDYLQPFTSIDVFKADNEFLGVADDSYIFPFFNKYGKLVGCDVYETELSENEKKFIEEVEKKKA